MSPQRRKEYWYPCHFAAERKIFSNTPGFIVFKPLRLCVSAVYELFRFGIGVQKFKRFSWCHRENSFLYSSHRQAADKIFLHKEKNQECGNRGKETGGGLVAPCKTILPT